MGPVDIKFLGGLLWVFRPQELSDSKTGKSKRGWTTTEKMISRKRNSQAYVRTVGCGERRRESFTVGLNTISSSHESEEG